MIYARRDGIGQAVQNIEKKTRMFFLQPWNGSGMNGFFLYQTGLKQGFYGFCVAGGHFFS
jgi:hypothetical protein